MVSNFRYVWEFCAVLCVYTASFWFCDVLVLPVQSAYFPSVSEHTCLLFIPHAVRLLTIWLYGFKGLLYLLITAQFSYYVIYDNHPTTFLNFTAPFVAPLTAYLFMELFKKLGPDPYKIKNWKTLIIVGVITSFTNGFLLALIYGFEVTALRDTVYFALGDLNGLVTVLFLMFLYFKIEAVIIKPAPSH
jgi:hypothetical protein